jgi:hypothetical protein
VNKFYVLEHSEGGAIVVNGMDTKAEVSSYLQTKYPTETLLNNAKDSGNLVVLYGHLCAVQAVEVLNYEIID